MSDFNSINIDSDIIAKFESLPEKQNQGSWTPEKDALLLKYWPIKKCDEVANLFGKSVTACRDRYTKLSRRNNSEC